MTRRAARGDSKETELGPIPGLLTTGFRQVDSRLAALRTHMDAQLAALRAHVDEGFDATIRAVAEVIRETKSS